MPLNAAEQLLSDTADFFQRGLSGAAAAEFEVLMAQGSTPSVGRDLGEQLPGCQLVVGVKRE
jgi:hypothetical protein